MPSRTKLPQYRQAADETDHNVEIGAPEEAARDLLLDLLKGRVSLGAVAGLSAEDMERLVELGRGHLAVGKLDEARRVFEGLCALEPEVAAAHQLLAAALERLEAWDEAQAAYTRAIHLLADTADPGLCAAYLGRGTARFHLSDLAGALTDLTLAREHDPDDDALITQTVETMVRSCTDQLDQGAE